MRLVFVRGKKKEFLGKISAGPWHKMGEGKRAKANGRNLIR